MNIEEKRIAIIDCVNSKRLSAIEIERSRKGATISKLKKGLPCKEQTIEKLYNSMIKLEASKPIEASITSKPIEASITELQEQVKNMQAQIDKLQEQIKSLQTDKPSITKDITSITPSITSNNIMGFSITRDKKGRYIGVKRIAGKLRSVYIGYDINLAIDKITEYLKRFE